MRRVALISALALLGGALAVPAGAGTGIPTGARCASGALAPAATQIFGAGTEVVARQTVAGLDGALVLEPRIHPGTRARLLRVDDSWCEATSSFNLAWTASGRSFDGTGAEAAARAYAEIAAAPYFDGVRVTSIDRVAPGIFTLTTHALTNGIDADWVIAVDDSGVTTAKWVAKRFAQRPFHAEKEGLTALPGGTERYVRSVDGLLASVRGLPTAESARKNAEPGLAQYVTPDKFVIAVSVGDTRVALNPGQDTGVRKADIVRENLRAIRLNYNEFYKWGMRKGWGELEPVSGPNKGYVYINDALSFYCFACVFIADDFQIHMFSEVEAVLAALGYTYKNSVKAYQNVIGHEMFHNFQNRYNKPGPLGRSRGRQVPTAYSEGTARAQEALHSYSKVSFQKGSLIYANDANGCNGYAEGPGFEGTMAAGIFNRGYTACFFWLSWYGAEGKDGLVKLVSKAYPKVSPMDNNFNEGVKALSLASRRSVAKQLAHFAGAAITGRGYRLNGFNWAKMLERWRPMEIGVNDFITGNLGPSGMVAGELTRAATLKLTKDTKGATLFLVIDTGKRTITKLIGDGQVCVDPKRGQKVYFGAVRAVKGSGMATVNTSKPTC